ncbi:MAG: alpha-L-fucosidase [Pseudomonadota bacterium]
MNRIRYHAAVAVCAGLLAATGGFAADAPAIAKGPWKPTLQSLDQWQAPEWFRDAKFGIWAHWGPQAVPRQGDWYARKMYIQGDRDYDHHLKTYGHPSEHGFKDIIPQWQAQKFDPERLMALYKKAGARYFVSMGVHHDNFDLWNSKFQSWNAVKMGPHRDIVGSWQKAAKKQGLRFGVSEHLGASFAWYSPAHGSDATGPKAGVPYDGADPRYARLYHPAHDEPYRGALTWYANDPAWHAEWFNRVRDLVDSYQPDFLYTDGGIPFGITGRSLVAHFRNQNPDAVYTCKQIGSGEFNPGACLQDVERGGMPALSPRAWQTDTSVGDWFYNENWKYRPTEEIVKFFVDIVSKNGNLLLNVVQRPEGDLDPDAEKFLAEMTEWTNTNGEGIFATRPWLTYGEGPTEVGGHFKEDFGFTAKDIRYTRSKDGSAVYAFTLGWPDSAVTLESVVAKSSAAGKVQLLGRAEPVPFHVGPQGQLVIDVPALTPEQRPGRYAYGFKLTGFQLDATPESVLKGSVTTIALAPQMATLQGHQLRVGSAAGAPVIAGWLDARESVHWLVNVEDAGRYRLAARMIAPMGASRVTLEIAGTTLEFAVPDGGVARNSAFVEIGEAVLPAGVHHLTLRATDGKEFNRVDIAKVYLAPVT